LNSPAAEPGIYANGEYLRRHPGWHQEDAAWKAAHVKKLLGRHAITPGRVCEVGCGSGEILACLEPEWGSQCIFDGYEISPQAFALSQRRSSSRLRFHLEDFGASSASGYDVILLMDVIEHVEDPFSFLRAIAPRGKYKVMHIPLDLSILGMITRLPERVRASAGHLHYFTKELALQLLAECGYRVREAVYTNGSVELPPKSRSAAFARAPRALCYGLNQHLAARLLGGCSLLVLAD